MSEGTTHRVKEVIEYSAEDHASATLHGVGHAADKAGHSVHGLKEHLGDLKRESGLAMAAMFGVGFGLGAWVEKAKEANKEFNETKRGLAALYSTSLAWDKGTSSTERYTRSLKLANENTEQLEEVGMRFGQGLGEVGRIYKTLGIAAAPLKLTQKQLLTLTEQTAAAAKLYGAEGADAANKVGLALMGRPVRATDDFGKGLYNAIGHLKKGGSGQKALADFTKAMSGFTGSADEASKTMGVSFTRIQMTVDKLFRDLTSPVMAEMAKEISDVAKQLQLAGENGKPLIQEYAVKLVEGFREIVNLSKMIADHWKEIAAVWGSAKVMGLINGLGGVAGMTSLLESAALAAPVLLAAAAAYGVTEIFSKKGRERQGAYGQAGRALSSVTPGDDSHVKETFDILRGSGLVSAHGKVQDMDAVRIALRNNEKLMDQYSTDLGIGRNPNASYRVAGAEGASSVLAQEFAKQTEAMFKAHPEIFTPERHKEEESNPDADRKLTGKPVVNIAHLELKWNFEDMDPERVFVRFKDDMEKLASTRTMGSVGHPDLGNE